MAKRGRPRTRRTTLVVSVRVRKIGAGPVELIKAKLDPSVMRYWSEAALFGRLLGNYALQTREGRTVPRPDGGLRRGKTA